MTGTPVLHPPECFIKQLRHRRCGFSACLLAGLKAGGWLLAGNGGRPVAAGVATAVTATMQMVRRWCGPSRRGCRHVRARLVGALSARRRHARGAAASSTTGGPGAAALARHMAQLLAQLADFMRYIGIYRLYPRCTLSRHAAIPGPRRRRARLGILLSRIPTRASGVRVRAGAGDWGVWRAVRGLRWCDVRVMAFCSCFCCVARLVRVPVWVRSQRTSQPIYLARTNHTQS